MRVKDLWLLFPLPAKIKLFWDRITLTRVTTIYFVFSILHCIVQVIFQAQAFHINAEAADFLASITEQGNAIDPDAFYVFANDLRLCHGMPKTFSTSSCQVIWDGRVGNNEMVPTSVVPALRMNLTTDPSSVIVERSTSTQSVATLDIHDEARVIVNGFQGNESAILDTECLSALGWPVQILRETKREDLTFIMFQIWVLGMSIVAILNESIPHIIASLVTHLVVTGWAGFQIFNTTQFHRNFVEVTANGDCHPIDLLPTYWQSRSDAEMMSMVLNAAALLISAFLSWRLSKTFGLQTFKRCGASGTISRVYHFVLMLSIIIQLSLFFIVTSVALWLDQLWHGAIAHMATWAHVYRPVSILILILLPLWLAFGWYSVRRERKTEMLVFLAMCLCYLAVWGTMLHSTSFRWTYITWAFFGVMTTSSVSLTLLAFILGIVCRLNFGKGLPHYLNTQEPLDGNFESVVVGDPEKMALPSNNEAIAFGYSGTSRALLPLRLPAQVALPRPVKTNTKWSNNDSVPF